MNKIGGIMLDQLQGVQQIPQGQNPELFAAIFEELTSGIVYQDTETMEQIETLGSVSELNIDEKKETLIAETIDTTVNTVLPLINQHIPLEQVEVKESGEQLQTIKGSHSVLATLKNFDITDDLNIIRSTKIQEAAKGGVIEKPSLSSSDNSGSSREIGVSEMIDDILENRFPKGKLDTKEILRVEEITAPAIQSDTIRTSDSMITNKSLGDKTQITSFETNIEKLEETILRSITTIKEGQSTTLKVKLEPENLGKVDLDLTMENGRLNAKINVESNQVRELFNENLSQLHQGLLKQNIQVGRITLEVNTGNEAGQWDFNKQGSFRQSYKRSSGSDNIKASLKSINEITAVQTTQQPGLNVLA